MTSSTDQFAGLFADVSPLALRKMIVLGMPKIAVLTGDDLDRVRRLARANSMGLRMMTAYMAVQQLKRLRPDLGPQLEDEAARNWVRGELQALRKLL